MPNPFNDAYIQGANMYLKMQGVKDERERNRLLNKLTGVQIGQEEQKQKKAQEREDAIQNFWGNKVSQGAREQDYGNTWEMGGPKQNYRGLAEDIISDPKLASTYDPMKLAEMFGKSEEKITFQDPTHNVWQGGQMIRPGEAKADSASNETAILSLPENDPRRQNYVAGKTLLQKQIPPKVPSLGNAAEIAISRKFQDPAYLTDPEKFKIAASWLNTVEGSDALRKAATEGVSPSITYLQTSEGYVPATTRGAGVGEIGQPTGLGKPIPSGAAEKMGGLEALLNDIKSVKTLYLYGTDAERKHWVGPVQGRVGSLESKYAGTASDEQVRFYAYVDDMQDALLRARSGAQINEQEFKRLVNFLPDKNLPSTTFKARLDRFEAELNNVLSTKRTELQKGGYGSQGSNPTIKNNDPLGIR